MILFLRSTHLAEMWVFFFFGFYLISKFCVEKLFWWKLYNSMCLCFSLYYWRYNGILYITYKIPKEHFLKIYFFRFVKTKAIGFVKLLPSFLKVENSDYMENNVIGVNEQKYVRKRYTLKHIFLNISFVLRLLRLIRYLNWT